MTKIHNPITLKQIFIAAIAFILINLIAGYGVIILGANISGIYATLNKPYFAPPTWVFGVAWTINVVLVIYGMLRTYNLPFSITRSKLLVADALITMNYLIFQYVSFGSPILFGKLLPIMFFLPTLSMLVLTILAMYWAYQLDTRGQTLIESIKSGHSIFASFTSLFGWLIIATALGFSIWIMN
jgi:translocator protein